jgi:hypothetical protein
MIYGSLPKSLLKYADRIESYSDERAYDNPIFVGYAPGWKSWTDPVGVQHADAEMNVKEILYAVRHARKCNCEECR